jgi:hypothetical protein
VPVAGCRSPVACSVVYGLAPPPSTALDAN